MSAVAIIIFLIGSGLLMLGAFFLWYFVGNCSPFSTIVLAVLPTALLVCMAVLTGESEIVAGVIWGTVALNLGVIGVLGCLQVQLLRTQTMMATLWLSFGWLVCVMASGNGAIGKFSGWGLIVIGLIAVWQSYQVGKKQTNQLSESVNKKYEKATLGWRRWLVLCLLVVLLIVGAGLVVWYQPVVAVFCGMPLSLCSLMVLAAIALVPVLLTSRRQGQWQFDKVLRSVTWANVLLTTLVLGLSTVFLGGLHLTQSVLTIVLPWVAGMTVLSVVKTYLPQKTARWLGGLIVIMFCGMIMSLFW